MKFTVVALTTGAILDIIDNGRHLIVHPAGVTVRNDSVDDIAYIPNFPNFPTLVRPFEGGDVKTPMPSQEELMEQLADRIEKAAKEQGRSSRVSVPSFNPTRKS